MQKKNATLPKTKKRKKQPQEELTADEVDQVIENPELTDKQPAFLRFIRKVF